MTETRTPAQTALDKARDRANRLFDQVKTGHTVFYKAPDGNWALMGPAADLQPNTAVTVTKADGSTTRVVVTVVTGEKTHESVAVRTAGFIAERPSTRRPETRPAAPRATGWSKYSRRDGGHPLGEVVAHGDGYTVYRDTFTGRGGEVQIWDES